MEQVGALEGVVGHGAATEGAEERRELREVAGKQPPQTSVGQLVQLCPDPHVDLRDLVHPDHARVARARSRSTMPR
eukprot:6978926-Alexandrium_andersonii.AAC.1